MQSRNGIPKIPKAGGGGKGYSWEFLVGVCRSVLQILNLFPTKEFHYSHSKKYFYKQFLFTSLQVKKKQLNITFLACIEDTFQEQ